MEIKFYNSLTNKIETFKPIKENEVSIYCCGPTVYNDPHIGNMRPAIIFDTLVRFLKYVGYDVKYVSNYTDVDDKIINKALEEGVDEKTISERYIKEYKNCLEELNCLPAFKNPKVTEYIDDIVKYIDNLVQTGAAYVEDGEVYFDVTFNKNYGCLSKIKLDELDAGNRVATNEKKHNPYDFLLWKKTEKGIKWDTKWCQGRPGWHTECCVMIDSIFGGHIDIHGGGHDLLFPHHENEVAQAEATNHNTIANYWIHNGMMNINGDKMSKSLGNVIFAKDGIKELGANVLRLLLLNCQYRGILTFSDATVNDAKLLLSKLENAYKQLNLKLVINDIPLKGKGKDLDVFLSHMANDLNLPNAITELLEIIKKVNLELRKPDGDVNLLRDYFYDLNDIIYILGLNIEPKELSSEEKNLYQDYLNAKANKDFAKSDELRKQLIELEII